jgi:DNA-binding transcriptional ArsR family regulator
MRGYSPSRPIHPAALRNRLSDVFTTRAATLHELAKLAPVTSISEALGYSPATKLHRYKHVTG